MTQNNHFYDDLGVADDASADEIRSAYKHAAQNHHPDKGGDTEKFQALTLAYKTLSNPEKRQRYDETGEVSSGQSIDDRARSGLHGMFVQMLNQCDAQELKYLDVMKSLRGSIRKDQQAIRHDLKQFEKGQKDLLRTKSRTTKDFCHLFGGAVNEKMKALKAGEYESTELLDVSIRMIEMLDEFEWQKEEKDEVLMGYAFPSSATASSNGW